MLKLLIIGVLCWSGVSCGSARSSNGASNEHKLGRMWKQDICDTEECRETAKNILDALDQSTDPCQDFYKFACGGWIEKNEIPSGKSKWGRFYELRDRVDQAIKDIVEMPSLADDPLSVRNLRTMYSGCMDTVAIEAVGLTAVLEDALDPSHGWPMVQDAWTGESFDVASKIGESRRMFGSNLILSLGVAADDLDTETNVVYIDQPSLGLPLAMYLDEDSYEDYILAYKQFIVDLATVMVRESGGDISETVLKSSAEEIYQLEKSIALIMTPESERRNSTAMYNPITLAELKEQYSQFNWDAYFASVFSDTGVEIGDAERFILVQPDYLKNIMKVETTDEMIANYLYARFIMKFAKELTAQMRQISFRFDSVMSGATEEPIRWQTCTSSSTAGWGFAAAYEYIKFNFNSELKAEADRMVEDLRAAFKELVFQADWMDVQTQMTALDKADRMLQLIGYPDWLTEASKLEQFYEGSQPSDSEAHFDNVVNQLYWSTGKDLTKLRMAPDREVWPLHPAIVNAWYSPNHNTITFPAGILQPPFFRGDVPRYLNYGAMGMVIGHEITHGFDDQGRQYDGTGNLQPWWTEQTLQGFLERAECFIQQYTNYTVNELVDIVGIENAHLNGKNTQGENIADNGGIHESFRAYLKFLESAGEEPALPGLEQYTSKQMFFISNAQVWCEEQTDQSLLAQVLGDPHSPGKFRVLGPLSNSQDFRREWNCPQDSPMVRPNSCTLW